MNRFCGLMAAVAIAAFAQSANAEDLCQTLLVGSTYTCSFSTLGEPTTVSSYSLSFTAPGLPEVQTAFQGSLGGFSYLACACTPKGKPGKLKPAEKSAQFYCDETAGNNNETIIGKVAGAGSKIVKGLYLANNSGDDTGVFTCVKN